MSVEKRSHILDHVRILACLAVAVVLPLYAIKVWHKTDYTDFDVYYRAASRMAQGDWAEVYSLKDGASPFRYAPVTLPFFRPFAALPLAWAKMVWFFLQAVWFGCGLYFLFLALERVLPSRTTRFVSRRQGAQIITALSFLFILRFCLDCFTIGQISSLLFLAFSASFYFWTSWRTGRASTALLLPALVKIGPAFLYPLFLHGRPKPRARAILAPFLTLVAVLAASAAWIGPWDRTKMLWSRWMLMVSEDSSYYDASHYGSQSVKSALLRMANWHWIAPETALRLHLISALALCGAVLGFWLWRVPRRPLGRAASFALGLFPYLWVMPETFKYSLTVLAIPSALLFADTLEPRSPGRRSRLAVVALIFGALTLSLAGKDVIGDFLFFGSQKASIPLLATFILGLATAQLAWRHSRDSWLARELKSLFRSRTVSPWEMAQQEATIEYSLIAPLPMQSATSIDAQAVVTFIRSVDLKLRELAKDQYEILIQPYGDRLSEYHPAWTELRELAAQSPSLRLLSLKNPAEHFPTRNAALRESFLASRGRRILTTQLEQPCDPEFYLRAAKELDQGFDLVRGNRRMHATRFRIPVRLLSIVHQRHRMGLRFNRLVRALLPIKTTDTHSGILAMTRTFASQIFALQSSLDFLFDLEISMIATTHEVRQKDLPLTLILAEEKSRHRMTFEALNILIGLPRLARRYRSGFYSPMRLTQAFTADDWGLTPEVNQGILELARSGVIKCVSLMARSSYLTAGLDDLRKIPGIELGLHFDLTYQKSGPGRVLLAWLSPFSDRKRLREEVRAEFQAQIAKLRSLGIQAGYLDGHHHIHLAPGMIDAIADEIRAAGISRVRCPYDPSLWTTSKAILIFLSLAANSRIRANGFSSLRCFYPQNSHFLDPGRFRASLVRHPGSEIIVHPARSNDLTALSIPDPYTDGRVIEYRALRMLGTLAR